MPVLTDKKALTGRQERFCQQYENSLISTKAAIAAGYSARSAAVQGSRLLRKANVQKRIGELAKQNALAAQITPGLVLASIRETMDRCKGDEESGTKFDARGVLRSAELLGRYLSLFTDKSEHSGVITQKVQIIPPDAPPEEAAKIYAEMFRD